MEVLPSIAWFEDYSAVFSGSYVRQHHLFPSAFDLANADRSFRCNGLAPLLKVPVDANPPLACDGMSGVAELACSDERQLQLRWIIDPDCRSGYGQGTDQDGNRVLLLFGGSQTFADAALEEAMRNQSRKPALPAIGQSPQHGLGTGTAFFVSWNGHLVTNHHVVAGGQRVQISLDDELVEAKVLEVDEENDLALLEVEAIRTPLYIAEESELARGASVVALGYPLIPIQGRDQKATIGYINALSGIKGDDRYTQLDAAVQPGNSGGPVLNDRGEVVGVVTMILNAMATLEVAGVIPQNVNYALKAKYVDRLMDRALGEDWAAQESRPASGAWPEVIARAEDSVVLVLVEK